MTDRDVIARVAGFLGRAVVNLPPRQAGYKPSFVTTIKGAPGVEWMQSLRPYLSTKRQDQVDRALQRRQPDARRTKGIPLPARTLEHVCDAECDIHWLAGLLEGEGTFSSKRRDALSYPVLSVEMTEESCVRRAAAILGAPSVRRVEARELGWSATFVAGISGQAAATWMRRLQALMGERRSAAIQVALLAYAPVRLVRAPTTCVVPNCGEPHRSRGLCHKHYMSWMRDLARGREPRVSALR